ncbi:MAG: DUF2914 domain-containing protein [Gemmatimonadota bacterium]
MSTDGAVPGFWRGLVPWYRRHEKWGAVASFAGGVGYDFATLTRIDRLLDNLALLGYLLVLGGLIAASGRLRLGRRMPVIAARHRSVLPLAIQFLLGSLFSAYTVFYFASVSLSRTGVFFALLVALLLANEALKDRLENLPLLMGMLAFAAFSFFVFFVPVMAGLATRWTFGLAVGLSALLVGAVLLAIAGVPPTGPWVDLAKGGAAGAGLLAVLVMLHVANWIPPVPLALRSGGIYHEVRREGSVYHLTYVRSPWYRWYRQSENPFRLRPGDRAYCFASVSAPARMHTAIYHRWQRYDERRGEWEDAGRIGYEVTGGRQGGYRGYTYKQAIAPGRWRVDVETEDGQLLGRVRFAIVAAGDAPLAMERRDDR